jgi:gliding motility-associated protein GldM
MAHEKLSPRQKMIGMMYLVLTAMLALNVSKEAVEAFKKVDKGLTLTISNYVQKNNLIYSEFNRAAAENPTKAGKYKNAAYEVKQRADEAFNFIQGLKIEIINKAEGPENLAVKGDEVIIEAVKLIDNTNIPSEILVGAEGNGKANDMKALLIEYRDFLIATLAGKNPTAEDAIRKSLNTDDGKNKDGKVEPWAYLNFQTLPLVAVICILSEYQVSVRNAETEVINYLYTQIDASNFKFTNIDPVVIPNSNYVTLGSDYEAKIFISATDSTKQPDITVGDTKLDIDETGKGTYKVRATSIGPKKWGGVIALKAPDGTTKTWDVNGEYVVGESNVIVSATAMNVMYMDIGNPIDVSLPGVSPDKITIKVNNGTFSTEKVMNSKGEPFKGAWAVKPIARDKDVEIIAVANINGKPVQYPPYRFRVKPIPLPQAVFAQKSSGSVSRADVLAQQGVFAVMPDFDFDLTYKVTQFTIFYTDKTGLDIEEISNSSNLTPKQRQALNGLTRGKNLTIKDIKAVGPGNKPVDLNSIILKIN